jgi:ABC-type multidrug transport system fused ATPase/permease subunit
MRSVCHRRASACFSLLMPAICARFAFFLPSYTPCTLQRDVLSPMCFCNIRLRYQLLRTYISFWTAFWQSLRFGMTNEQHQIAFAAFVVGLIFIRLLTDFIVYHRGVLCGVMRTRKAFSDAICNAPLAFFMTESIAHIATVFSRDLVTMSESFADALHYAVIYACVILAVFLRMVYEIPLFAIPLIMMCAVGSWVMVQYARKLKAAKLEFEQAELDVFRAICNAIEGVKVIRTADCARSALENIAAAFRNWRVATVATDRVSMWLFTRMEPIAHVLAFTTCIMSTQLEMGKGSGVSVSLEGVSRRNMVMQALSFLIFLPIAVKRAALAYAGMTCVEKVFRYIQQVPREHRSGHPLDSNWPSAGDIELRDLCLRYSPSLPNALDNINLKLPHGAKVGVCGRTGCGKSSLFVAVFRLLQFHSGRVVIAGREISNVDVTALRQRMSIIPQEPVMFGGSLRENIDPLELFSDDEVKVIPRTRAAFTAASTFARFICFCNQRTFNIKMTPRQEAVALVGLEGTHADLNSTVANSGQGWSQGEKQLVSAVDCCCCLLFAVCCCCCCFCLFWCCCCRRRRPCFTRRRLPHVTSSRCVWHASSSRSPRCCSWTRFACTPPFLLAALPRHSCFVPFCYILAPRHHHDSSQYPQSPGLSRLVQATAALDQHTEARFQSVLDARFASSTIVCVAHRVENLRWCNMRVEMGEGKVVSVTRLR